MTDLPPRLARTFANAAFWKGAAATRTLDFLDDKTSLHAARAVSRAEITESKCAAGCPLEQIPELQEWLAIGMRQRG